MLINSLVSTLNSKKIQYCHWKSNRYLGSIENGEKEYDILVYRHDGARFESVISQLGFKRTQVFHEIYLPAIHHYYGYDEVEDMIIHVHVFYRVITGESLVKNYHLPIENMIFSNLIYQDDIPLPDKSVELVIFVIRMMIKHGSLIEAILVWRDYDALIEEVAWLLNKEGVLSQALVHLQTWLPLVDTGFFCRAIDALRDKMSFFDRYILGRKMKRQLRPYARFSSFRVAQISIMSIWRRILRKIFKFPRSKMLSSGGAIIAFVGPEATGKSTLVDMAYSFLGRLFSVEVAHLGKPPSTIISFVPNLLLPLLKRGIPYYRTSCIEQSETTADEKRSSLRTMIYAIRSLMVSWDRRVLAGRLQRKASCGSIIICDRYPSNIVGAADSQRLADTYKDGVMSNILNLLCRWEHNNYETIIPPDLVIRLSVPIDVALLRNKERQKEGNESDDYVRRRHAESKMLCFPRSILYDISTDQPIKKCIRKVRSIIWNAL